MKILHISKDVIFVSFDLDSGTNLSEERRRAARWAADNDIKLDVGYIAGVPHGIFLDSENAVAFMLAFNK